MDCRPGCGACCVAPSISTRSLGLPKGKAAGERCPHLTQDHLCALFGSPDRPPVCASLRPQRSMCGEDAREAFVILRRLERITAPAAHSPVRVVR
jgi:uncharacterized protein